MPEIVSFSPEDFTSFSQYNNTVVIAQAIEDPDVLQQIEDGWNNFIESGQVWALIIGFFLGYLLRTFIS
ncbi:hypothetical protein FRE64_06380 [Euhalothece natronophila Z-M001]|uniref:Uncharacterized protein n=1 Tax=Euhalothece natronophila Z-M001 TaxID=522448 RepID=A0A5B8NN60_9CHRO|nr:hypothetical protein [Euhalothece natronophila]QDZ39589.1 hypothetical protein FRE64_06380 [Euhalothece natronophila Z-M001]